MKKIDLEFMICPDELVSKCKVPRAVRIKITDPYSMFLTEILGDSGRKMVCAGLEFYFTKPLADKLIAQGIARRVQPLNRDIPASRPYSEKLARKYTNQVLKMMFNC